MSKYDDGLTGKQAKKRAYELILAGPDTPTRRFLKAYLAKQNPQILKSVDDVLADDAKLNDERNKQLAALATAKAEELPY